MAGAEFGADLGFEVLILYCLCCRHNVLIHFNLACIRVLCRQLPSPSMA